MVPVITAVSKPAESNSASSELVSWLGVPAILPSETVEVTPSRRESVEMLDDTGGPGASSISVLPARPVADVADTENWIESSASNGGTGRESEVSLPQVSPSSGRTGEGPPCSEGGSLTE